MGGISYALYLWHVPVDQFLAYELDAPAWLKLLASVVIAFALAVASRVLVERPALKYKRHFAAATPTSARDGAVPDANSELGHEGSPEPR